MLKNNKGNVLNTVLIVTVIIIIISYGIMKSSLFVSDTVKNNKLSSNSIIDVNNNRIENNQIKGDLFVSNEKNKVNIDTVSLDEGKTLEVNIPGNNIMNSKIKLDFNTGSVNRYVGLELSKTKNNKLLINKNIDTRGGFIIKDSSAWTETAQETNYNQQIYYLQNSKLSELSNYINSEIIKIGEPGSYLLFDFGYSSLFNNFNYQLTNENKTSFPNIIQLTFDNGVQYSYLVNDTKEVQKLFFPDIETKYIRLDILSTSDGRVDVNNTNVINNIDRNINSDEITVTDDEINKTLNITFPNLSLINGVKFVNLYSGYNGKISTNSFKSLLGTETNFIYHYNNISLDTIYFELCSDINVCLEKVSKPIN